MQQRRAVLARHRQAASLCGNFAGEDILRNRHPGYLQIELQAACRTQVYGHGLNIVKVLLQSRFKQPVCQQDMPGGDSRVILVFAAGFYSAQANVLKRFGKRKDQLARRKRRLLMRQKQQIAPALYVSGQNGRVLEKFFRLRAVCLCKSQKPVHPMQLRRNVKLNAAVQLGLLLYAQAALPKLVFALKHGVFLREHIAEILKPRI